MRRSSLTLVLVCTGWGTIPLLVRDIDLPPTAVVFARVWIAVAALAAAELVQARRPAAPVDRPTTKTTPEPSGRVDPDHSLPTPPPAQAARRFRLGVLAAGALLAVHWTAMFAGYQQAPADTVVFVVFLAPVGIALLAPRTLGERLTAATLAALALAIFGFVLVAGPALAPGTVGGLAWAGLSAVTFVGLVLVSKPLAEEVGGLRLNLLEMAVAGVLLVPFALAADWTGLASAWPWLVVLGLVHTGLGVTLYLAALARVPATQVGILGYLEPVSVVVLAWLVLGDAPTPTTALGGALVIVAGTLVVLVTPPAGTDARPLARADDTTPARPPTTPEVPARVPG